MNTAIIASTDVAQRIELARWAWLDAKSKRTGSARTARLEPGPDGVPRWHGEYATTLDHFRQSVQLAGLDLDGDPSALALLAQSWAGQSWAGDDRQIAATTYNQRLAIVSSFYIYARRHQLLTLDNPIDHVERRPVQAYAHARALSAALVRDVLGGIDRSTLRGQRDYTLLSVALATGRRASELAGLRRCDIQQAGDQVTLTWRRCKGGKVMHDDLAPAVGRVLLDYLQQAHAQPLDKLPPDAAVWISTSRQNIGAAISTQAIGDICQRHLGTSKIHTLRHTFAHGMRQAGADVRDIQKQLGHESSAVTDKYLRTLESAHNPHAQALAGLFGIGT